jgi:hypothetical protein
MERREGLVEELGRRIGEMARGRLSTGGTQSFSEMELAVRRVLLDIGRGVLDGLLADEEHGYAVPEVACSCGGKATYVARREAVLRSVFGDVHYRRSDYLCARRYRVHGGGGDEDRGGVESDAPRSEGD